MTVYFFTQVDGLRPTTNAIADRRFCAGLVQAGVKVEMIVPYVHRSTNLSASSRREAYAGLPSITLRRMPTPLVERLGRWGVPIIAAFAALTYLLLCVRHRGRMQDVTVISRDANSLLPVFAINRLLGRRRSQVLLWAHEFRDGPWQYRHVYSAVDGFLATNSAILEAWRHAYRTTARPAAVTFNSIPASFLEATPDRAEARKRLGLTSDLPICLYTGKLGTGLKEIELILEAARLVPDCRFILTAGRPSAVRHFTDVCRQRGLSNVQFTGLLPRTSDVRLYQRAADVLISYYTAHDHAVRFNLPQKLSEYMASHTVILSPDFPATRDLMNEGNAILIEPDIPESLAAGVRKALGDPEASADLAAQAFRDAARLTTERTGQIVVALLKVLHAAETD